MVAVSAFTVYMGFRLQLFFSPNPAKMTYLIFYKQLLEFLHLSASLQMTAWKKKK